VAFDVYRAVGGGERLRIFTMRMIRYGFAIGIGLQVVISLLMDKATYRPGNLRSSWRYVKKQPFLSREVWEQLKSYEVRGFHPDDRPTDHLVEEYRERLFGANGAIPLPPVRTAVA